MKIVFNFLLLFYIILSFAQEKNTEVVYYMYNDNNELVGINKTKSSAIRLFMANNDIEDITFFIDQDGSISPEKDFEENDRLLKGFIWRGDERIMTNEDIFDEDDNNIELVIIRGINNPIDIDAEEKERSRNEGDPVNNIKKTNTQAIKPKKTLASKKVR